jgi:hypothetical protein
MRLLLTITAHGYGHLSQCAPVIAALRAVVPLKLIVRSAFSEAILTAWLGPIETFLPTDDDFGVIMADVANIDGATTLARYRTVHDQLRDRIGALAQTIIAQKCDVVLSNISYIATAAAAMAGVPSVAFCSLAWHEIIAAYFPNAKKIRQEILTCYRQATKLLRLRPGTPFRNLRSALVTQPIARTGQSSRPDLALWLSIPLDRPMALLSFSVPPVELPPLVDEPGEFTLIGPAAWADHGVVSINATPLPYQDLLASVDVVVSKPGYSTVAELGCSGIPSVLVDRPDWPERPFLVDWLQAHGRCLMAPHINVVTTELLRACQLLPMPLAPRPTPGGETEVAATVLAEVGFVNPWHSATK